MLKVEALAPNVSAAHPLSLQKRNTIEYSKYRFIFSCTGTTVYHDDILASLEAKRPGKAGTLPSNRKA